jgi:hypothetical protein
MVNNSNISEWIKQGAEKGYSPAEMRRMMREEGFSDAEINKAFGKKNYSAIMLIGLAIVAAVIIAIFILTKQTGSTNQIQPITSTNTADLELKWLENQSCISEQYQCLAFFYENLDCKNDSECIIIQAIGKGLKQGDAACSILQESDKQFCTAFVNNDTAVCDNFGSSCSITLSRNKENCNNIIDIASKNLCMILASKNKGECNFSEKC